MRPPPTLDEMPVVRRLDEFDEASGSALERLVFRHRAAVVLAALGVTAALGWSAATRSVVNADFERLLPGHHPFVQTYRAHRADLRGLGNTLRVAVQSTAGDVYDAAYLASLRDATDALLLAPGVDRRGVRSLWTPAVRWTEVTEEGFRGGPVMPDDYDGSPASLDALRRNVLRAGLTGGLVSADARSSVILVPLLDRDPETGRGIDSLALARTVEQVRARAEAGGHVRVHVVGFAQLVADLVAGIQAVARGFAVAVALAAAALLLYTRCVRSTVLCLACSAMAVVWQVGIVSALGLALDPFSVLVPFLVFASGVSHGTQKMNGILQDVGRGTHRLVAARYTFRRLFLAGVTALLTDAVSFAVIGIVAVPAVRELALTTTVGAGVLVFTNLLLLPVLLSYTGVSARAAARSLRVDLRDAAGRAPWRWLERLTEPRWAAGVLVAAAALAVVSAAGARRLEVGNAAPGAPELRPDARYNRDAAFLATHHALASDLFAVVVRTPPDGCLSYETLVESDRLAWELRHVPGVLATAALPDTVRRLTAAGQEGNPRWRSLSRDPAVRSWAVQQAVTHDPDVVDRACAVAPVVASLADHRAGTLEAVVHAAREFSRAHAAPERSFVLAAGSAGLEAARNEAVRDARTPMAAVAYAAVVLLCFATFRSWRAVVVTVLPLALTGIACEALMVRLGIGLTVSSLPVLALGVGIPDFALYLLTVQLAHQRAGAPLAAAHRASLLFTGKAVALVSVTLAAGVVTWAWSPIQLQADMGILLTFLFLGNLAAALLLVPALSTFLLARAPVRPEAGGGAGPGEVPLDGDGPVARPRLAVAAGRAHST